MNSTVRLDGLDYVQRLESRFFCHLVYSLAAILNEIYSPLLWDNNLK